LIADPLNCTLRLDVIFHFSSQISIFLYTEANWKKTFSVIIIGNVFSMGGSVHPSARPHRSFDAKPEARYVNPQTVMGSLGEVIIVLKQSLYHQTLWLNTEPLGIYVAHSRSEAQCGVLCLWSSFWWIWTAYEHVSFTVPSISGYLWYFSADRVDRSILVCRATVQWAYSIKLYRKSAHERMWRHWLLIGFREMGPFPWDSTDWQDAGEKSKYDVELFLETRLKVTRSTFRLPIPSIAQWNFHQYTDLFTPKTSRSNPGPVPIQMQFLNETRSRSRRHPMLNINRWFS
jgi:hypothetical protein